MQIVYFSLDQRTALHHYPGYPNAVCATLEQLTFMGHHHGVTPWGEGEEVPGLPARIDKLDSLVVTLPLTYTAVDKSPGWPNVFYPRHSFTIDVMRTLQKPVASISVAGTLTDEIVIRMNYNPNYGLIVMQTAPRPGLTRSWRTRSSTGNIIIITRAGPIRIRLVVW
jgi:hypothetical protein